MLYLVIRCGVYRHEILNVSRLFDAAQQAAIALLRVEPDHHHSMEITLVKPGEAEQVLGVVSWRDSYGPGGPGKVESLSHDGIIWRPNT